MRRAPRAESALAESVLAESASSQPPPQPSAGGSDESAVTFDGVSFQYASGVQALKDVTLRVDYGEIVSIVGPSGCGKSTLLSLVAGLATPTSGQVRQPGSGRPDRHPVSMVFQKDTVLPWLTVEKNVGLTFRFANNRSGRAEHKDWISYLLDLGGLTEFRKAYPYQLSGGMRRRVAFLTSVAARPEILLLDEPFSALDEPTRVAIHQSIYDIVRELGITVLLVTHDISEALSLSDEVVMLTRRPGRVAAIKRVPFGRDRRMLELREQPEFLHLYAELWRQLRERL